MWEGPRLDSSDLAVNSRPPAHTGPRAKSWTVPIVMAVVAAAVTVFFAWGRSKEARVLDALESSGRKVTGRVVDVTWQPTKVQFGRAVGRAYFFQFGYVVNGEHFSSNGQIDPGRALTLRPGSPIAVTYLPSDPRQNLVGSMEDARIKQVNLGPKAIFFCGAFWLAAIIPAAMKVMKD
jgi:uncharacterized protein DUF3592